MSNKNDLVSVLESILFMYGRDISFEKIAEFLNISQNEAEKVVEQLEKEYNSRSVCGLQLIVQKNKVQLVTHPNSVAVIEQITKKELEGPLTPVAMEVLAIIAYRGPINKVDVEAIRGVNCSFTLRNLLRRGLIERIQDTDSRLQQYQTTVDLLRILGVDSVEELPEFKELSEDKRIDAILYSDTGNESIE